MPALATAPAPILPPCEDQTLRLVVEGTETKTGTEFFQRLVRNLADALGTAGAWVTGTRPEPGRVQALAFWINGQFLEPFEPALPGTPCELVINSKSIVHFPDGVRARFPAATDLQRFQAVSYLGGPLLEPDGHLLGHLAVLDTKPLPRHPRLFPLFEIFAARASAERRRLNTENEVRSRDERLLRLSEETARLRDPIHQVGHHSPDPRALVEVLLRAAPTDATSPTTTPAPAEIPILTATQFTAFEKANLERALHAAAWKIAGRHGAAARLGVPPSTLSSRMKALGIQRLPRSASPSPG